MKSKSTKIIRSCQVFTCLKDFRDFLISYLFSPLMLYLLYHIENTPGITSEGFSLHITSILDGVIITIAEFEIRADCIGS